MPEYAHTQFGWWVFLLLLAAIGLVLVLGRRQNLFVKSVSALVLCVSFILFGTQTITVGDQFLEAYFGPGILKLTVPINRIDREQTVRMPIYARIGWINTSKRPYRYVSGRDAVLLGLNDGTTRVLGTDEPAALAAAIGSRLAPVDR